MQLLTLAQVHVGSHTRGMTIYPDESFADLVHDLRAKFPGLGQRVNVRFKDEDGDMMSMQDDGDFEAAIDVARYVPAKLARSGVTCMHKG